MKVQFVTCSGGGFLLHPETERDFNAVDELVSAGIANPSVPGTESTWDGASVVVQAAPYGANFGELLFGLVAHGSTKPFVDSLAAAEAEWMSDAENRQ
jgi:hypothetical protein